MAEPTVDLRRVVLGDEDLHTVAARVRPDAGAPWSAFARAAERELDDPAAAVQELLGVASETGDTRARLQAWRCLRDLGHLPPTDEARRVRAAVVEIGFEQGVDVVVAYEDHTARHLNDTTGSGVFWDRRDDRFDAMIDSVLVAAQAVADSTTPLDGPLPDVVGLGAVHALLVSDGGISLGTGPMEAVMADELGSVLLDAVFTLANALGRIAEPG